MAHKVAIIGSGRRGTSLLNIFNEEEDIQVVGVVDIDNRTPSSVKTENRCLGNAKKYHFPVFSDYILLTKQNDLEIILDVTRSKDIHKKITQNAPKGVEVLKGRSANIICQLAKRIEAQKNKYEMLYETAIKLSSGYTDRDKDIFGFIVEKAAKILEANHSELYVLGKTGKDIKLRATNDPYLKEKKEEGTASTYARREGLTGWVFKTGQPLFITDITKYKEKRPLDDDDLCGIYNGSTINEVDRSIQWLDKDERGNKNPEYYLAVPIKSHGGEVIGVIRVSCYGRRKKISNIEIHLLTYFAMIVSVFLRNEKEKDLKDVLLRLGNIYDENELFCCIVNEIPKLILGRGCSIFHLNDKGKKLELAYTNSHYLQGLIKNGTTQNEDILTYKVGEGKTGSIAKFKRTLIIKVLLLKNVRKIYVFSRFKIMAKSLRRPG